MIGKIYFFIASFLLIFSIYYEMVVNGFSFDPYKLLTLAANLILVLAGYAYFFKKQVVDQQTWKVAFYIVVAYLSLSLMLQFMPKLFKGEIAVYYFNLMGNLTGFIIGNLLFVPLYLILYKLSGVEVKRGKTKNKKRR